MECQGVIFVPALRRAISMSLVNLLCLASLIVSVVLGSALALYLASDSVVDVFCSLDSF